MRANPILEEVWRIKDELAREAGFDVNRYCEQLRAWSAAHPHPGPIVRNAEELRGLAAEVGWQRAEASGCVLKDAPPRPDQ